MAVNRTEISHRGFILYVKAPYTFLIGPAQITEKNESKEKSGIFFGVLKNIKLH